MADYAGIIGEWANCEELLGIQKNSPGSPVSAPGKIVILMRVGTRLFRIDNFGIEGAAGLEEFEGGGGAGDELAVEAGIAAGVAGSGADLFNEEDEGVLIAIGADFDDFLGVSGSFAFVPNFRAGAGPVDCLAELEGEPEGFGVHEGKHEGLAGGGIEGDGGDQAVGIELRGEIGGFLDLRLVMAG